MKSKKDRVEKTNKNRVYEEGEARKKEKKKKQRKKYMYCRAEKQRKEEEKMTTEKEENIEKNTKKKLRTWRKSGKNRDRCIGRKKAQRLKRIKKKPDKRRRKYLD